MCKECCYYCKFNNLCAPLEEIENCKNYVGWGDEEKTILIVGESYWESHEEIDVKNIYQAKIDCSGQYADYVDNLLYCVNGWNEMINLEWEELEETNLQENS
jgi:hypothetical protein